MQRYFLELSYNGACYAGFQVQENANTVQAEVERSMAIYYRSAFELTGSSRTDAGVHARQNFFHFDSDLLDGRDLKKDVYHLNAILPADIAIKSIRQVRNDAHCRFDADYRHYIYTLYRFKDPFLEQYAWYYPYTIDLEKLQQAAAIVKQTRDFESFAKKNSQVKNFLCNIYTSEWKEEGDLLKYHVSGNRFLRGMVRGLVATMVKVGRNKIDLEYFKEVINKKDSRFAEFASPARGLRLETVSFKKDIFFVEPGYL